MSTSAARPPRMHRQHRYRRRADMPLLGGIRPPIALLLLLLISVSAVTAVAVGGLRLDSTPQAVRESQQYTAEDGAGALRAAVNESATDLRRAAAGFDGAPAGPNDVLATLGQAYQKWRGTVVVRPGSGQLLAAQGETVPLSGLDLGRITDTAPAPVLASSASGPRLLVFALVATKAQGRVLLVASDDLRLPSLSTAKTQTVEVLDPGGRVLDSTGPQLGAEGDERIVADARRRAARQRAAGARPGSEESASGSLTGAADPHGVRRIVGYAAVGGTRDLAAPLGLTVVSSTTVDRQPGSLRHPLLGLAAAGTLLLLALLIGGLLVRTLQRPLLQLFLESRRLTRGERLDQPVTGPNRGEAGRITRALEEIRRQLLDPGRTPGPTSDSTRRRAGRRLRRPGIALPLALCAAVVLGWSGPLLLLGGNNDSIRVPQQVVAAQRDRTDSTADRVRQALNEGYADLRSLRRALGDGTGTAPSTGTAPGAGVGATQGAGAGAGSSGDTGDTGPLAPEAVLRAALAEHGRYRSLYLLSPAGAVLAKAGEAPRHTGAGAVGPDGVLLLNTSGKEPQIAARAALGEQSDAAAGEGAAAAPATATPTPSPSTASAPTPGTPAVNGPVLVGEFKLDFLVGLLDRAGLGHVWLLDERQRILAANQGFSSFGELPEGRARSVLADASKGANADVARGGGDPAVLAAAKLGGSGSVARLGWSVVSAQPVSWLHLDQNRADRRTMLAGMLGLAAAALCLGWLYIAVGLPLRRLAAAAEELAAGDRRTVLYPVHHDEVGAVARSLELLRQRLDRRGRRLSAGRPADAPARSGPP